MWDKWRQRYEPFGAVKISFLTSKQGGANRGKEITGAKCLLFYNDEAKAKEGLYKEICLTTIIEKTLCLECFEVLIHEEQDFEFSLKDSVTGAFFGTKKGHPMMEFNPTGLAESRGSDKHKPGIIISRVFEMKKHRQRVQGKRIVTYSFSDTSSGIVFAVHLKGIYWATTPPPDMQEYQIPKHYMSPRFFVHDDNSTRCVYSFLKAEELKNTINKFEAGTFTKWKHFCGVGFEKKYAKAHTKITNYDEYTAEKLMRVGDALLIKFKDMERRNRKIKMYYFPGIGVCIKLKSARMICYRTRHSGDSVERKVFTKSSACKAILRIGYWGVLNPIKMKMYSLVTEIVYPGKDCHDHSLDEFSISASDTFPKLRAYIEKCVDSGMGHQNTFIQVRKFAKETLVPSIEQTIGKKISLDDTRFFPTKRTVYTYWLNYAGGSVKACEDQNKIRELLHETIPAAGLEELYYKFEPFDPRLLAKSYGIPLDKSFEGLLAGVEKSGNDFLFSDDSMQNVPILPDDFFDKVEPHLRPKKNATAQQRYDMAVKLLVRDSARQTVRAKANIDVSQRTGAFYLFLQTKMMANLYANFGHDSILFMDSGYRVNRNAFPITFVSILDNFMKGRVVGVMISQFTDELTYAKCLSEFKRGHLSKIKPQCAMTDFDLSEIGAFRKTWPDLVMLICTFHAIAGQNKWINRNAPKSSREKLKTMFKELHYVNNEEILKRKMNNLKRFCTRKGLTNVKQYLQRSWEPFVAM